MIAGLGRGLLSPQGEVGQMACSYGLPNARIIGEHPGGVIIF